MKLINNTVLITGGSSGLGLELAKRLSINNTVIICGRSEDKLLKAKQLLKSIHVFKCDLSVQKERERLFEWVSEHHPECNILVNNAAIVHRTAFDEDERMIEKSELEIQVNLVAPIVLTKLFLPLLRDKRNATIINITTGLVYAPKYSYPIYNATKAGLHSFTQVIRHHLLQTKVKVVEVLMPVVDTPWHNGNVPSMAISPSKAISEMIEKLESGEMEIRVGKVGLLYLLTRIYPALASKIINSSR